MTLRSRVNRALWPHQALWRPVATLFHPGNRGRRSSALGRAISYEVRTTLLGRPTRLPIGRRSHILAHKGEVVSAFSVVCNPPNWPDMLVWQRYLRPGDLFIDVGANVGTYAVYAAECGAEVVAIEPDAGNARRARENLARNGYVATVIEAAVTAAGGVARLTQGLDDLNHLVEEPGHGIAVRAVTLDEVIGDRTAWVKIDVEGAEELVLRGAERCLAEQRIAMLQLEWVVAEHMNVTSRSALRELLFAAGYVLCESDESGVLRPIGDEGPRSMNVFAVPERSAAAL